MPVVGLSRSQIMFIRVDLPLPEGHMIATNSPSEIVRVIHLSICIFESPRSKDLVMFSSSSINFKMVVVLRHQILIDFEWSYLIEKSW